MYGNKNLSEHTNTYISNSQEWDISCPDMVAVWEDVSTTLEKEENQSCQE